MAASRPASGVFRLAGRLPQCGQQVSAVTAARARDSTAVKQIWPGASRRRRRRGRRARRSCCGRAAAPRLPGGRVPPSVRAGRGGCRGRSASDEGTRFLSATADAHEVEIVSSVTPGSGAILGVGALLQAATLVRRLRSAAAGERDAAECRECGDSRSGDLGDAAAGAAGCGGGAAGDAGSERRPAWREAVVMSLASYRLRGQPQQKIRPEHLDRAAIVMSASRAGSRSLSIPSPRGCSTRSPSGRCAGLGAVAGRGDRRRSRGVGGDGGFPEGLCQARHGGHDGTWGVVLDIEMSRLARTGRDWHQLLELCSLSGVLLADPDGVYDPGVL